MRTRWLGVLTGLGVTLAAAAPTAPAAAADPAAPAAPRIVRTARGFMPVGSLDYIWKGDPARGCAAAGLCGVAGSLQVVTGNSSSGGGPGLPPIDIQDNNSVARVDRSSANGAAHPCVDFVPYDVAFVVRHRPGGKLRAVPQGEGAQPASAGQCAGPTAADLLPVTLPARKLARGGYDLSGSVSFGAGPFAITVVSTIRALAVSPHSFGPVTPPPFTRGRRPPKARAVLAEQADVAYRVTGVQGGLTASFSGLASPFCAPLDACGGIGAVRLALAAPGHRLDFSGSRLVQRRVGSRRALADLRAGRLRLDANAYTLPLAGGVTGTFTSADATPCRDTVSGAAIELGEGSTRTAYRLSLSPPSSFPGFFGPDELRTRCPGPGSSEILGTRPLATGAVAAGDVGAPRLSVVLGAAGGFRGSAYAGTRAGSITLTLVRTHVSAGTRRMRSVVTVIR